jgi:hypothetical protein
MSERPVREPEEIRQSCVRKVHSVEIGDQLLAILSFLLDEDWGAPRIDDLQIWARCVVIRNVGERDYTFVHGAEPELVKTIHEVASAAALDGEEVGYLLGRLAGIRGIR